MSSLIEDWDKLDQVKKPRVTEHVISLVAQHRYRTRSRYMIASLLLLVLVAVGVMG